jgi:glyoxylase-like metal-dependent hydrolase (beta-lactamase superfamily II)
MSRSITKFIGCAFIAISLPFLATAAPLAAAESERIYYPGQWRQVDGRAWLFERNQSSHNGAIILDDYVIMIDAGQEPASGKYVADALREITDKPIKYVILSHYHDDHTLGLPYFRDEGAIIIGHAETARIIDELGERVLQTRLELYGDRRPELYTILQDAEIVNVDITFENKMVLGQGEDRVEILFFGPARTLGDIFVWLPRESILYTGDAISRSIQPLNYDYPNIAQWTATLEAITELGAGLYVPMHGVTFEEQTVHDIIGYYTDLRSSVQSYIDRDIPLEQIQRELDLPQYSDWENYELRFKDVHIPVMYDELTGRTEIFYDIR